MLSYPELIKILNDSNINENEFLPENISEIYNMKLDTDKVLPLIEEMVLVTVDLTPLYTIF